MVAVIQKMANSRIKELISIYISLIVPSLFENLVKYYALVWCPLPRFIDY